MKNDRGNKELTWRNIKKGDVFLYLYEENSTYVGICDTVNKDNVVVSDVCFVGSNTDMEAQLDYKFSIDIDGDSREFKIGKILFNYKTVEEEFYERYPEYTI